MTQFAHILMLLSLVLATLGTLFCIFGLGRNKMTASSLKLLENANLAVTLFYCLASAILFFGFWSYDFSIKYVHDYSDLSLPLFYRLTAFWGGQAGSLLFWALSLVLCGAYFQSTESYTKLSLETKVWYLLFYFSILAFFGVLLTTYNNPFEILSPAPVNGRGLNPLLQNPGMIFHPPLLLLGYGGFTIPACLALAQALSLQGGTQYNVSKTETAWHVCTKPLILVAWLLLTAGIILGAWWAYMELGWGGYWAWDPVENASTIPWFFATAALHFGFIEQYRNKAHRFHTLFMALTCISAFFATWLVRGNVVESVHAFGSGGVGPLLLCFVIGTSIVAFLTVLTMPKKGEPFNGLETKEGFLLSTSIVLITISLIIGLATLWPVISKLWSDNPVGLQASFYNGVILPLLTVVIALLTVCPWLSWKQGLNHAKYFLAVLLIFIAFMGIFWTFFAVKDPTPLIAASFSVACMASWALYFMVLKHPLQKLSPVLVHMSLAVISLGVAFSGPYKVEQEVALERGQEIQIDTFTVKLLEIYEGRERTGRYDFLEAELLVTQNGKETGIAQAQRRIYASFPQNAYAEASTIFSLGKEFYATFLGLDEKTRAVMRLSVHPLVNWLWIGGTIMSLAPFISVYANRKRRKSTQENPSENS